MEPNTQFAQSGKNKNLNLLASLSVVVLLIVGVLYYAIVYKHGGLSNGVNKLPEGYVYKTMEKDQYPVGFPKNIVVSGGVWQSGEDTKDATGHQIKIVELLYKNTASASVLASYEKSFKADGWVATPVQNSSTTSVENFTKNFNTVTLLVIQRGADAFVNLTQNTR